MIRMKYNRIIFLDIDGVLWGFQDDLWEQNATEPLVVRYKNHPNIEKLEASLALDDSPHVPYCNEFNPHRLGLLVHIINALDVKVVLSSTWRKFFSIETIELILNTVDGRWRFGTIIDKTPVMDRRSHSSCRDYVHRHHEITYWLERNEVERYVVIDDDYSASPDAEGDPFFVNIDGSRGFIYSDAQKVLRALGVRKAGNITVY